jgi:hypothetical protein
LEEASTESPVSHYEDPSKTNYPLVIPRNNMKNSVFRPLSRQIEGRYTTAIKTRIKPVYIQVKKKGKIQKNYLDSIIIDRINAINA